ncbi:hypothetical protein [Bacteroides fragilis]|uniref:hypothetical protein n=1 Tax=Bacteroides fragilis TaxID=817 RepID=UPI00321BC703
MEAIIIGIVEDVQAYEGKSGYGCNIKLSQLIDKRRKTLTFSTKNPLLGAMLEEKLQEEVTCKLILDQNNFGLRILDVKEVA